MDAILTELAYEEWFPRTGAEQQEVLAQLERILASRSFRQSKRSAILLRFIVENTLKGHESILKERTLGIEVFERAPDYDTNADPVVRMAAGEIRKRIAQYYHDASPSGELHIDLPSGSYVARFRALRPNPGYEAVSSAAPPAPFEEPFPPVAAPVIPSSELQPAVRYAPVSRWLIRASAAALVIAALAWVYFSRHDSLLDQTWGSVLAKSSPVLISAGQANPNPLMTPNPASSRPPSGRQHPAEDALSYSEVQVLLRLVAFLEHRGGSYLEPASATSFSDLQRGPAILIGGLNNPWTLRAQQNLRFRLATDGNGVDWIEDARNPNGRRWTVDLTQPYPDLKSDYAIVARFFDQSTQEPTLIVAGLGENGTKAASQFITDKPTLQRLAGDWISTTMGRNFEVVLETQLINGSYGPPKLLAKEIW